MNIYIIKILLRIQAKFQYVIVYIYMHHKNITENSSQISVCGCMYMHHKNITEKSMRISVCYITDLKP